MKSLNNYINDAKQAKNIKSDRLLCQALNLSNNAITSYRTQRAWPTDETMVRLAELGGNDPELALIDLNIWRTPAPAQKLYLKMFEKLTAAVFIAIILLTMPLQSANATTYIPHYMDNNIYYEK